MEICTWETPEPAVASRCRRSRSCRSPRSSRRCCTCRPRPGTSESSSARCCPRAGPRRSSSWDVGGRVRDDDAQVVEAVGDARSCRRRPSTGRSCRLRRCSSRCPALAGERWNRTLATSESASLAVPFERRPCRRAASPGSVRLPVGLMSSTLKETCVPLFREELPSVDVLLPGRLRRGRPGSSSRLATAMPPEAADLVELGHAGRLGEARVVARGEEGEDEGVGGRRRDRASRSPWPSSPGSESCPRRARAGSRRGLDPVEGADAARRRAARAERPGVVGRLGGAGDLVPDGLAEVEAVVRR